jgi:hypothetical protein
MMNEPRLATAIAWFAIGIIAGGISQMIDKGGVKFILQGLCYLFLIAGVLQLANSFAYHAGQRIREINGARVVHITQVANSISSLTSGRQMELVESLGLFQVGMIMGNRLDTEPILFLKTVGGGEVMYDELAEFLRASVPTYPALLPIRRGGQPWRKAEAITATFIALGVAEKVGGSSSARLTVPIEDLARHLYVDLDIPELEG